MCNPEKTTIGVERMPSVQESPHNADIPVHGGRIMKLEKLEKHRKQV